MKSNSPLAAGFFRSCSSSAFGILLFAFSTAIARPAYGDYELTLAAPLPTVAPTSDDPFAKGQWTLDLTGGYTHHTKNGPQEFFNGTVGVGYTPIDSLMLVGEITGDYIDDENEDGYAGGITIRVRYRVLQLGRASLFVDGSIGLIEASVDVPDHGTHFNFREALGLGVYLPIADRVQLIVGARAQHISNADFGDDNPGYNGAEAYVGVSIPL